MKTILALAVIACCSVACVASSDDAGSQSSAANANRNGPNDDRSPADDDPGNEEGPSGPTCNDPQGTIPDGWTTVDYGKYTVAIPPHSIVMSSVPDPTVDHVWYVFTDPMKAPVGHVQVARYAKDMTEAEAFTKERLPNTPITWSTYECRKDLVSVFSSDPRNELHHVDVGGEVVMFGCIDMKAEGDDLCTKFIHSFHVK
jgi:hypothetical protein